MQSQEISGSELGTIKYISELLDWNVKRTANLFILILIFVFDPLAITLVIATNQAFKGKRKDEVTIQVTVQETDQVTVQETDQVPTNYRPSTEEVTHNPIIREKFILPEEETWNKTREETNEVINNNIKRLIYKK